MHQSLTELDERVDQEIHDHGDVINATADMRPLGIKIGLYKLLTQFAHSQPRKITTDPYDPPFPRQRRSGPPHGNSAPCINQSLQARKTPWQ